MGREEQCREEQGVKGGDDGQGPPVRGAGGSG